MSGRKGGIKVKKRRPRPERLEDDSQRARGRNQHRGDASGSPKLFRNKTVNTVLVVPTKARKYRQALYIFAFVLAGFGLTLLSLSITMLVLRDQTILPEYMFQWMVAIGILTLCLSGLGGRGSVVSNRKLETGEFNWWLIILAVVSIMMLLFQFGGIFLVALTYDIPGLGGLKDATSGVTNAVDLAAQQQFENQPVAWWDFQRISICCGYRNNTIPAPLATGKWCTTSADTSEVPCHSKIWDDIAASFPIVLTLIFVFMASEMVVCVSSMCLSCFIKAQEPIYAG